MPDVYWESAYREDRERLLAAMETLWPFDSVLELGCNSGPVRRRLRMKFGVGFAYVGLDINEEALMLARQHAADDPQAVFQRMDIRCDLQDIPDGSMDVVVATSVLMCIDAAEIGQVLAHMRRIAVKAVVVQEDPCPEGASVAVSGRGWRHPYPDWVVTC